VIDGRTTDATLRSSRAIASWTASAAVCASLLALAAGAAQAESAPPGTAGEAIAVTAPKLIAYVTGWSPPVTIDTSRITHVNFAFARIDGEGRVVLPDAASAARLGEIVALKRSSPALEVLISIGGWGADGFSDAALTAETRARFADSAVELMKAHGADGIDVDWEYPGQSAAGIHSRPEDKRNFTLLLEALRARLDAQARTDGRGAGNGYLLTIASADREYFDHVEMDVLHAHLDWINVMAYDFYNSLTPTTGHHAGLHRAATAPAASRWAEGSIAQHLAAGVPARKLVLGVAFYGRRFEGVEPTDLGRNRPYGRYGGDHAYSELVARYVDRDGYVRHWDDQAIAPWLWNARTRSFISYDDPRSIGRKAAYAHERGLGGIMFWELSQDADGSLLEAARRGLTGVVR
jgi:chitinase